MTKGKNVGESSGPKEGRERLGEILVKSGLINSSQLQQVLKRQTQVGGHLGSILIEMGFITVEDLIRFLIQKYGVPGINLFKTDIHQKLLTLLPVQKMKAMRVIPVEMDDNIVRIAMVNPQDFMAISEIEFMLGKKVRAAVTPSFMMDAALSCLPARPDKGLQGATIAETAQFESTKIKEVPDLATLLGSLTKYQATDILLTAGVSPSIRVDNKLLRLALPSLTPMDCEMYARELIPYSEWDDFITKNEYDFTASIPNRGRYRANCYRQRHSISIALRPVMDQVPSWKELNLPEWLLDYAYKPQGLILITGPAGHGKTMTLSALIDAINANQQRNIVTLEDPIEILHKHRKSNINQREIGTDTESFASGLKTVFRQSPDVIVIGEMRDRETFETAIQAADTGHLVISSVHANNSTAIFDRVINMFEPHRQPLIRTKLADCLLLVLSQRLIPRKKGKGLILALEYLKNTYRIKNFIKEQNTHQIRTQMQAGTGEFESVDLAIARLYKNDLIQFKDGLVYVEDEQFYCDMTGVRKE